MKTGSILKESDRLLPLHTAQPGLRLAGILSVVLIGFCIVAYWQGEGSLDAVRFIDRWTIRISVVLFSLSFVAPALASLFPSGGTSWIFRNRRSFMISFVTAFALHLCAIGRFYALDADLFRSLSPPLLLALRGLGVVFVILMLVGVLNENTLQRWRVLITVGEYYVWAAFLNGFAKRVTLDGFYFLPATLLILALALKVASMMRVNKTGRAPVMGRP
jgi:methionine sulfoxide reductase heme-binding subunit